jgi:type I restriction enzyme S subunit
MSNLVPDGWINCRYESLLKGKLTNGLYKHADFYGKGNAKILDIGYLFNKDKSSLQGCSSIELTETERTKYKLQFGDILFNRVSVKPEGVGQCVLVEEHDFDLVFESNIIKSTLNLEHTNPLYISYLLNSEVLRKAIFIRAKITAQASIGQDDLLSLELLLPPLPEQQKIAQILTSVDEVLEKTQAQIDKLKDLKTAMMQELLTNGIGHLEFKDSPVGRIPVGWDCVQLEALLANTKYPMRSGPFGSALLKHELVLSGSPYLGIDNVHVERFDNSYKRYVDDKKFEQLKRYSVFEDDVMITIMGTVGRSCVVPKGVGKALSSKHVWTMTFDDQKYLSNLICWQLNHSTWVRNQFKNESQGGVMESISSKTLKQLWLPLPPISEQRKISKAHVVISKLIESKSNKLKSTITIKKALMQDLLTGKVRVNSEQSNPPLAVG